MACLDARACCRKGSTPSLTAAAFVPLTEVLGVSVNWLGIDTGTEGEGTVDDDTAVGTGWVAASAGVKDEPDTVEAVVILFVDDTTTEN